MNENEKFNEENEVSSSKKKYRYDIKLNFISIFSSINMSIIIIREIGTCMLDAILLKCNTVQPPPAGLYLFVCLFLIINESRDQTLT